ncbi:F0F1 ATP synthase subunit B family protein [Oceanirhabdus sp. W0125-5]|uniref:F0F1 ATP synthase subunit B family protein n=1 Tax=Oceanirhabdus sp. W0125-5 TaxID=2999116 RepID=UPI0022F320F2|nr:hypothetical protein [Oceanirhabdus sp. W0125-5]WBW98490.1 hypothetical protein OW730_06895 [Oceanirhabdus sp. W0125-5]
MIELNLKVIAISLANFIILLFVLNKIFFSKLSLFLDNRKEELRDKFEKIDEENKKILGEKNKLYKEELNIKKEGSKIIQEFKDKAMEERAIALNRTKDEIEGLREKAKKNLEDEEIRFQKRLKSISMDLSTEICKKVLKEVLDEESQKKIIDSFINRLEKTDV